MAKKNRKKNKKKIVSATGKPFVSVCTPTYNRRKFIPNLIKCFKSQTYPSQLIEWIIVDDGDDPVGDLFQDVSGAKYYYQKEKMKLGKKRNFMHTLAKGEIIVYMDDDDFYPPERINHVVNKLRSRPKALACGSSALYVYFLKQKDIYLFGPYGPNHATAGTFGFRRELLKETSYDDEAEFAEEKQFLKNYTVPFVQLNPMKSILCFAHDANTFDKNKLIQGNPNPEYVKKTKLKLSNFINKKEIAKFYIEQ